MGEPAGVGTEITLKAYRHFADLPPGRGPVFCLIDDPARVEAVIRDFALDIRVSTIEHPKDAASVFAEALPVLPLSLPLARARGLSEALAHVRAGAPSSATAGVVEASIRQAVDLALDGAVSGVVTNPIQKKVLADAGWGHPGHTEFLGALTAQAPMPKGFVRGPVMMLAAGDFRVVPVTVHLPLRDVADTLSADAIVRAGVVTAQALRRDFGVPSPVIAVSGLNPHAGEDGALGKEERDVIGPAIAALREQRIDAIGPLPADTMFHERARRGYSAALAMYHDQALVPIKTIAFDEAVNITLGLPIVRTSPDHGTALDIAGTGRANADSLIGALSMAAQMADARAGFGA